MSLSSAVIPGRVALGGIELIGAESGTVGGIVILIGVFFVVLNRQHVGSAILLLEAIDMIRKSLACLCISLRKPHISALLCCI